MKPSYSIPKSSSKVTGRVAELLATEAATECFFPDIWLRNGKLFATFRLYCLLTELKAGKSPHSFARAGLEIPVIADW